jgi:hypothetical protein
MTTFTCLIASLHDERQEKAGDLVPSPLALLGSWLLADVARAVAGSQ